MVVADILYPVEFLDLSNYLVEELHVLSETRVFVNGIWSGPCDIEDYGATSARPGAETDSARFHHATGGRGGAYHLEF
jgi:hypothetical protein